MKKERTFQRSTDSVIKVYRFFNDKLYWGRTVYEDPELETEEAIVEKIIEIYGKFDYSNKWTQDNKEYISLWSNISPTFSIEVAEIKYFNAYGRAIGINMFIKYENTKTQKEVDEYFKEKKKKNIEL